MTNVEDHYFFPFFQHFENHAVDMRFVAVK